ncbi:MAG: nitroreductase family deazaflavin-dependent oxidoreductase [Acidobacteria bacterium]|nr:nitroreductase family deazaflavin-dependent oxidoreductase [Acidobacteriota bacterium]
MPKPDEAFPSQSRGMHHNIFLVVTWVIRKLLRASVPMGPMILLTVRGRKSGQPRTTAVDLFERDGRSFLVSTHGAGDSHWVRNLRAAGEAILTRGRRQRAITAIELTPEAAGPVLKKVLLPRLALPVRGFVLRRSLGILPDASVDDFINLARTHPVFEVASRQESFS